MRLSKQGRSKKGSVAPISDDEDSTNSSRDLHADQPRQAARGVSFSTSRGKIWLILVINLSIVTAFIFMSSSRFPSLYGEGAVSDALEQDQQHPGPMNKNVEQEVTSAPQVQEASRPGGYTKLTSTDHPKVPDEELDMMAVSESEAEVPPLSPVPTEYSGDDPSETPALETDDHNQETEPPLPSVTREADVPASDVDVDPQTVSTATNGGSPSEPVSNLPSSGQRSPAEIADLISRMKEAQTPSSETLPPPSEQPDEAEYGSTISTAAPHTGMENEPAALESKAFLENLSVWLTGDSGVEVENLADCLSSSGEDLAACGVSSWINQIASSDLNAADSTAFRTASPQQKPVWIPIVPDTHNQLPTVYFSCPMVTNALRVHESMTLLFVLSPARIETGDSYPGQKFFGNSPYGQFALHGGKPSFFANNGLVESAQELPAGQFSLVTYRLHQGYVEIKANGGPWGGEEPMEGDDERHIRVTVNDVVSLGNSKGACDTNAFQGRIAEVLVYDAVLNDARVEAVEKYLHDKWWGSTAFPEAPETATTVAYSEPAEAEVPQEEVIHNSPTADSVDQTTASTSVAPENKPQVAEVTQEASLTENPLTEKTQQTSTAKKPLTDNGDNGFPQETTAAAAAEDATLAPRFDPRTNIFEWVPPSGADSARATRWTSTVKEKVDYIRNFQLGGDVLRALIRQHKDELVALRDELFG
ncbi:hypothetical protein PHYPSEUDO_003838 [Phytophthora pseudosyringae]|uniref:Uncharacterized protein n=1 Tax=Phytophthora pseudosyringae TaxID=221518 RepID=A0A8T1VT58_9STRA|nr:hypothetical protein PHYPSEUDO_003838 [Phytophthora pseudosyringae]